LVSLHVLGVDATGGVAGRGLQQHGAVTGHGGRLEAGHDGTAGHRFGGEQIGRSHQHADVGALFGQRPSHGGHHGGRAFVVNPAREQHMDLVQMAERQQLLDLGLPQGEAGAGADMAAAFPALEHELAGPVAKEPVQQPGGGNVQERVDAGGFQRRRLGWTPACNEGARGADVVDHGQLGLPQLGWHEAQDPDAPGAIPEQRRGFLQQGADLVAAHQRQGEERQAAPLRHGQGERRPIADPGHGALRHRDGQASGGGEG